MKTIGADSPTLRMKLTPDQFREKTGIDYPTIPAWCDEVIVNVHERCLCHIRDLGSIDYTFAIDSIELSMGEQKEFKIDFLNTYYFRLSQEEIVSCQK